MITACPVQWRIALARAIYRQPRLLIMDEVTSATDSQVPINHGKHRELREQSQVILITHNMPLARTFENIIVIKDGRIEDTGYDQLPNHLGPINNYVLDQMAFDMSQVTLQQYLYF